MKHLQRYHGRHGDLLVPETFLKNASFVTNWRHVILYICVSTLPGQSYTSNSARISWHQTDGKIKWRRYGCYQSKVSQEMFSVLLPRYRNHNIRKSGETMNLQGKFYYSLVWINRRNYWCVAGVDYPCQLWWEIAFR